MLKVLKVLKVEGWGSRSGRSWARVCRQDVGSTLEGCTVVAVAFKEGFSSGRWGDTLGG